MITCLLFLNLMVYNVHVCLFIFIPLVVPVLCVYFTTFNAHFDNPLKGVPDFCPKSLFPVAVLPSCSCSLLLSTHTHLPHLSCASKTLANNNPVDIFFLTRSHISPQISTAVMTSPMAMAHLVKLASVCI